MPCSTYLPQKHESIKDLCFGGYNLHLDINFEDGVTWIARFRLLQINRPSVERVNFDRLSEVATYNYLLTRTNVPVPVIYAYVLDGERDNPVGVGYIMMEKLLGRPMNWLAASAAQKAAIFHQLRDIYIELEKIPSSLMGRPVPPEKPNAITSGPPFFYYDQDGKSLPCPPIANAHEWHAAVLYYRRDLIANGEIAVQNPSDALLVNKYLSEHLDNLINPAYSFHQFFLKHIDTRDCNFLVDDDYKITGIIDWEMALFAPKDSALQSPLFMVDVSSLYEGNPVTSSDEERFAQEFEEFGRRDIAEIIRDSKKIRCLEFSMYEDPYNRESFEGLFAGAWRCIEGEEKEFSWQKFRDQAKKATI